jgi:hypothetical protein
MEAALMEAAAITRTTKPINEHPTEAVLLLLSA